MIGGDEVLLKVTAALSFHIKILQFDNSVVVPLIPVYIFAFVYDYVYVQGGWG